MSVQIWKQLQLTPSSVQSSFDEAISGWIIAVYLAHEDSSSPARPQLHKLGNHVPFFDIRPPHGIVEVCCAAAEVSVVLSQRSRRKRKRNEAFGEPDEPKHSDVRPNFDGDNASWEDSEDLLPHGDINLAGEHEDYYLAISETSIIDQDDEKALDEPTDLSGEDFSRDVSPARTKSPQLPEHDQNESSTMPITALDGSKCAQVIEAALQLAICGSSSLSKSDLTLSKTSSICPLADVVPSIWSPGYLPSVASRAVLMPTIAHALSSVLGRAGATAVTRPRTRGEAAQFTSALEAGRADQRTGSTVLPQIWNKAQSDLHQKKAARQLKPLWYAAEGDASDWCILEALLDGDRTYNDEVDMLGDDEDHPYEEHDRDILLEDDLETYLLDDETLITEVWDAPELEGHLADSHFENGIHFGSATGHCTISPELDQDLANASAGAT